MADFPPGENVARSVENGWLPSGRRLHNYGKSPLLMGKSVIKHPFSIAMQC